MLFQTQSNAKKERRVNNIPKSELIRFADSSAFLWVRLILICLVQLPSLNNTESLWKKNSCHFYQEGKLSNVFEGLDWFKHIVNYPLMP